MINDDSLQNKLFNEIVNDISNFEIPTVPDDIHFWMVRTKKGYFYNEFLKNKYVALAWNKITKETDLSQQEILKDSIQELYPEIKRATSVINKCNNFINEVKPGDILIIPSAGSRYITFAYAGEYFEDESKDYLIEQQVIDKIESKKVQLEDIECPYRKRRYITLIRTVKNEQLNFHLQKAISNYHGLSNLDDHAVTILDHIFNCYIYKNNARIIFHVTKTDPITSKEFSGFLYSASTILCNHSDDQKISTQATVHSIGDIVMGITEISSVLGTGVVFVIAAMVLLVGFKYKDFEIRGLISFIGSIINLPRNIQKQRFEDRGITIEQADKIVDLMIKMKNNNINWDDLGNSMEIFNKSSKSMKMRPYSEIPAVNPTSSALPDIYIDDLDDEETE